MAWRGTPLKVKLVIVTLAALSLGTAAAQFEVIGTVTGTLDGAERTWYALGYEGEDGFDATAWFRSNNFGPVSMHGLDLQVHAEKRYLIEGTLSITGTTYSDLEDCPCAFEESAVTYFPTSNMFEGVYESLEAELVVASFEVVEEEVVAIRGTFSAVLGFIENAMSGADPDPTKTLTIEGEFSMDRLPYEAP